MKVISNCLVVSMFEYFWMPHLLPQRWLNWTLTKILIGKCQFDFWTLIYKIGGILRHKEGSWQSEILMLSEILILVALQCLFPESSWRFLLRANTRSHFHGRCIHLIERRLLICGGPLTEFFITSLSNYETCRFSQVGCVSWFCFGRIFPMLYVWPYWGRYFMCGHLEADILCMAIWR